MPALAPSRPERHEPLLLFTDGDCVPPPDFLEGHLRVHGPRTFAVGGAYRLDEETSEPLTVEDVGAGRVDRIRPTRERAALRRKRRKSLWGTWLRLRRRPKIVGLT